MWLRYFVCRVTKLMYLIRIIYIALLLPLCLGAAAQRKPAKKNAEQLNKYDGQGKRHGTWLNIVDERKGEQAYKEAGDYNHGRKVGVWYKMDQQGNMVAIENYKWGVLDGEAKYFDNGQVMVIGRYRGLNPDVEVDTIMVEDPVTEVQSLVPVKSDVHSVRHGTWRYYNEKTGNIARIEEYQVDKLIYEEEFLYTKEDSLRFMQRMKSMPDPTKPRTVKGQKQHSYINY